MYIYITLYGMVPQKFDKRSSVVTATEWGKYWGHLSYMYMTEESDDADDCNAIVEHKLPWRSNSEYYT